MDLEQGVLSLEVCDDGVGMPAQVRHGRGLGNMHTRMREIGAQLHIRAAEPGTCVQVRLDLKTFVASAQRPASA